MERRPYFVMGDLASNLLVGALVAAATGAVVDGAWPMVLGMGVGMLLGDLIALPAAVLLTTLLGAMELMLPLILQLV